jgi:ribosomal protein S18 acetylase RimI-like enzyme
MAPTIRSGRPADAPAVVALWHRLDDVLPSATDDEAAVETLLQRDPDSLVVAERDGAIVATVIVGWDGWRGNLYRLAVDPAHRRSRIGSALIEEAEHRLVDRGCRRIAAVVAIDERHAVGFWTAAGYSISDGIGRFVKNLDRGGDGRGG